MAARNVEDLIEDQLSSDSDTPPSPGPVQLSAKGKQPKMTSSSSPSNVIVVRPRASRRIKAKNRRVSSSSNPKRHGTRGAVAQNKKPNYDIKYHPMDVVTRPNAKRTKVAEAEEEAFLSSTGGTRTMRSKSLAVKKVNRRSDTSSVFDPENLFTRSIELDWLDLSDFDRRVYLLQQGSPIKGTAIPLKWPRVAQILISEKHLTRKQLKDWGGEEALKQRYECVRLQMVAFFGADKEPEDRKDWKVYHMEGFEAYDLPSDYAGETNGKGLETRTEGMDEADTEAEDESDDDDNYPWDYRLNTEDTNRHSSARHRARLDESSYELSGSMHEIRDEIMSSIDTVMISEGEVAVEYEQHVRQKEAVDIVLSDRASIASAASPISKGLLYSTDAWPTLEAPVAAMAKMTETSVMQDRATAVPAVIDETESAGGTTRPSSAHVADTSTKLALDGTIRESSEPTDLLRLLNDLVPDTADSFATVRPQETFQVQHTTPVNTRRMKCAASSAATFTIHEDPEDISPQVNKQVALHPISPLTDMPKENYEQTSQDELDPPSQQLLNDQAIEDRTARTREAVGVFGNAVHHADSEINSPSSQRRPVFQPLPLDTNFNVVIEPRIATRATSVPTGASAGISTVTTGIAAQTFIDGSVRRERLARARAANWMND